MLLLIYFLSLILPAWTTRSRGPLPALDHQVPATNIKFPSKLKHPMLLWLILRPVACSRTSRGEIRVCSGVTGCAEIILCSVNHCLTIWLHQPITALPHSAMLSLMKRFEGSSHDRARAAESFCSEVPSHELHRNKIRTYVSVLVWSSAGSPNV